MKTFNPFDPDVLRGINLIEASAGTGKTYSITTLVLRLIVERGLELNQILGVTFSNAAAKEMRDRVRVRMNDALNYLADPAAAGDGAQDFEQLFKGRDLTVAAGQLQAALAEVDAAPMYTIHSFCQRMLEDYAFDTGQPFGTELLANNADFRRELSEDYWRILIDRYEPETLLNSGLDLNRIQKMAKIFASGNVELDLGDQIDLPDPAFRKEWEELCRWFVENSALIAEAKKRLDDASEQGIFKKQKMNNAPDRAAWFAQLSRTISVWSTERFAAVSCGASWMNGLCQQSIQKAVLKKHQDKVPTHILFEKMDQMSELSLEWKRYWDAHQQSMISDFYAWFQPECDRRKKEQAIWFYDDLLLNLYRALQSEQGDHLCRVIRDRFPAILIDEFQDTDGVQWGIFGRIYAKERLNVEQHSVLLIGDPKQSIYGFRSADIDVYLAAKATARNVWSMDTNYRSEPGLVAGLNGLAEHAGIHNCFNLPDQIEYEMVQPKSGWTPEKMMSFPEGNSSVMLVESTSDEKTVGALRAQAVESSVSIALHVLAHNSVADNKVRPGDIAVLVRTHAQAGSIRDALAQRGIPAVIVSKKSVFESDEAKELLLFLTCVLNPQDERLLRRLLLGSFFRITATDLVTRMNDESVWAQQICQVQSWHELWQEKGVCSLLASLEEKARVGASLLGQAGFGERAVSNFKHLQELLAEQDREVDGSPYRLLVWLERRIDQAAKECADEEEVRLESDANRVQVVTIHKSKGLQYPVVICPFLWDGKARSQDIYSHDGKRLYSPDDAYKTQTQALAELEELRMMYVAVTRAEHQLWVIRQAYKKTWPLSHWWAKGTEPSDPNITVIDDSEFVAASFYRPERPDSLIDHVPVIGREIRENWLLHSYSSLAGHGSAGGHADHDESVEPRPEPSVKPAGVFALPKGAVFGTQVHELFEQIDFQAASDRRVSAAQRMRELAGYDEKHEPFLVELVNNTLDQPLVPESFCLADIPLHRRLVEMDFHFPVSPLKRARLAELTGAAVQAPHGSCQGFIKGFIDLIFEAEGKYWIADYKTNYLGPALEDYAEAPLAEAMVAQGYVLQLHLYTLALHRYLKCKLPDYDYEQHIGGVFYLFVRGMGAKQSGVYFDRVPKATLTAMDKLFAGEAE